jgi:hypothetical protein
MAKMWSECRPGKRWMNRVPGRRLIGTSIVVFSLLSFARGLFWTKQEAGQVFRNPNDLPLGILKRLDAVLVLGGEFQSLSKSHQFMFSVDAMMQLLQRCVTKK